MASITKRGNKWQYRVSWRDADGKQHSKNHGGFRTKSEAANDARKLEQDLNHGADIRRRDISLPKYWHEWYTTYRPDMARSTAERYPLIEEVLTLAFGDTAIGKITPMDWQNFLNEYADGQYATFTRKAHPRAKETVDKLNSYVRGMVKYAINEQTLHSDFTFGAKTKGTSGKKESDKYLQLDQFTDVLNLALERASYDHLSDVAIFLGGQTGMRVSEVLGLTWSDINFQDYTIDVNKSWDYIVGDFKATKTPSSVRTIEVLPKVMQLLKMVRTQQAEWKIKSGIRDKNDSVFFGQHGQVLTSAALNKELKRLQSMVGIPKYMQITFHGLRHTHVSFLLAKGIDIYYISKRLGHANIKITMSVYSHLLDTQRETQSQKALKALDSLVESDM